MPIAKPHHCTAAFSDLESAQELATVTVSLCVQDSESELFNDIWWGWCDATMQQFYVALPDSTAGVLLLPSGASESYRETWSLAILEAECVLITLQWSWDFLGPTCADDGEWLMSGEEGRLVKAQSTFHLHMMLPWWTCCRANVNRALRCYWVHLITLHFFSLFTWRCSENSTEPALVCLFVSMLPFFLFFT